MKLKGCNSPFNSSHKLHSNFPPMATPIKTTNITFNEVELRWVLDAMEAMFPENYSEEEWEKSCKVYKKICKAYEKRFCD